MMNAPIFKTLFPAGRVRHGVDVRAIGILRANGKYAPITALDYYSHMVDMDRRESFPVGLPLTGWLQEYVVARLNEACAEERYPPIATLKEARKSVFREAMGLIQGKPTRESRPILLPPQ